MDKLRISVLIDNPNSWFVLYGVQLSQELRARGHIVTEVGRADDLPEGDYSFFLSCEHLIGKKLRDRNKHNIVIHGSALPAGKGWSPLTWQILDHKNDVTISLFEAEDAVDSGFIYDQEVVHFEGHELIDELRKKEGEAIIILALRFIDRHPDIVGRPQSGEESFYPKRTPKDSELDPDKSLNELFENLRVADNERYPAFFKTRGNTYTLKITKNKNL